MIEVSGVVLQYSNAKLLRRRNDCDTGIILLLCPWKPSEKEASKHGEEDTLSQKVIQTVAQVTSAFRWLFHNVVHVVMKHENSILTSQGWVFQKSLKCSEKRQDLLLCLYLASGTYIEPFPSIPYSSILFLKAPFYCYPENPTES